MIFSKNRETKRLRYEFLSAAEEIVESPPSPFGRIILWMTIALLAIALLWSYFGKLDVIVTAQGKVTPEGDIKTVQPSAQGIITAIKVKEGQKVTKGQTLIELDPTLAKSAVDTITSALAVAKLERDVLKKIDSGQDPTELIMAAGVTDNIKNDLLQLTLSKQSAVEVRKKLLSIGVSQAESQLSAAQKNQTTAESTLQTANNQRQQLEQAIVHTTSPIERSQLEARLQDTNNRIISLENSVTAQQQAAAQAQAGVSEANGNLENFTAEISSTSLSNVLDQDKKIAELEGTLVQAQKSLEQHTLVAPADGTILSLAAKTVGGVATPAQSLVTLVPKDATLFISADISTNDIGFVKVGQKVAVKVDTFSFQRYGYLSGTIDYLSADAVNDEKKGLVYKAKIRLDDTKTSKDNTIQVIPGMTVTSEVTTGQRRIIEFFLDPLITHVDESLKVR